MTVLLCGFRLYLFWQMHLPAELGLFLISLELLVTKITRVCTCTRALAATLAGVCFFLLVAAITRIPAKSDSSVALSLDGRL